MRATVRRNAPRLGASSAIVLVWLILGFSATVSDAVEVNRTYSYDTISPAGKSAIATFRQAYRDFLGRELAAYEPAVRDEITQVFEACLDNNYKGDLWASNALLNALNKKHRNEPVVLWHLAVNYFVIARRLPEEQSDEQARLLRIGYNHCRKCLRLDKKNPDCLLAYAASHGALALAEGIFDTVSEISDVKDELHQAYRQLNREKDRCPMAPWDADSRHVALAGLSEFYRLTPDWFLFRVVAGVRGDKKKSWSYARKLKVADLPTANVVARSALCYGADSENQNLINQGIAIVAKAIKFDLLHPFDEQEYRRLARLHNAIQALDDPDPDDYYDLGCNEFGNDDEDALKDK